MAEPRRVALWVALAATLAGVVVASRVEPDAEHAPRARRGSARDGAPVRAAAPAAAQTVPELRLSSMERPRFDLVALEEIARAWEPPPPPPPPKPAASAAPPAPQAPPLPFRYFGAAEQEGQRTVFVLAGSEVLLLRPGAIVRGQYRVESVGERQAVLTYLPLKMQQTLAFGGAP